MNLILNCPKHERTTILDRQMKIPDNLFRGDADKTGQRLLRDTINHWQLQTNLISGGYGRKIFEDPLVELINQHINIGWGKTHFLSFSEDQTTALIYGSSLSYDTFEKVRYGMILDETNWSFVLMTLGTHKLELFEKSKGIFEGRFIPSLKKFANHPFVSMLLVDAYTVLTNDPRRSLYEQAIHNADRDKEWLIFPTTPVLFENGTVEYTALLDGACLTSIEKYRI